MLMQEITQRRQQALKELYSRYARSLRALIGSVVHEESEADDVLQESFLQIWREAHHYSPKAGKPLGWVITMPPSLVRILPPCTGMSEAAASALLDPPEPEDALALAAAELAESVDAG